MRHGRSTCQPVRTSYGFDTSLLFEIVRDVDNSWSINQLAATDRLYGSHRIPLDHGHGELVLMHRTHVTGPGTSMMLQRSYTV